MPSEAPIGRKNPWVIAGVCLAGVTVVGLGMFVAQVIGYMRSIQAGNDNPFKQTQQQVLVRSWVRQPPLSADMLERVDPRLGGAQHPQRGQPASSLRIVEFIDYECPFCRQVEPVLERFLERHATDVAFVVRDFPLEDVHPGAFQAALAARCVFEQGKSATFWAYHDRLLLGADVLTAQDLRSSAVDVGADIPRFDECLSRRATEARVRESQAVGVEAGVKGTPTFFFNGRKVQGALDAETLEALYQEFKKTL